MGIANFRSLGSAFSVAALTGVLAACSSTPPSKANHAADLVFVGGAVYTLNEAQPWAEAVAVKNGRIVYVGASGGAQSFIGDSTEVVDIGNGLLLPGFHDSHMHPMRAGNRFLRCQLKGLAWPEEVLSALRACEQKLRPGQWLRGVDLPDELFDAGVLNRSYLDEIASGRPAYITNGSGFLAWANSAALDLAGIDASTPDPFGGSIGRNADGGELNGLLSHSAAGLVYAFIPEAHEADLRAALQLASRMANAFGITSSNEARMMPENHDAFVAADRAGELTLRINGSQSWDTSRGLEQAGEMAARRDACESPFVSANSVKLFLDGGLEGSQTAALLEPYVDSHHLGKLEYAESGQLNEIVLALDRAGLDVHLHAIGDRAVRAGLDAIEAATEANPPGDRRHQMAHLALVHPDDLPRFSELGVTANYQALWAYRGEEREAEIAAIGPERARRLYMIRGMLDSGARVVFGSDWISESMNPLYSIQIAVTRRPPDGSEPAWLPEQRITLEEALKAYTIDGAWLAGREQLTGSIEVGKAADLVVLEKNLFDVDPMEISRVSVLRTLLDGRTVYLRP